MTMAPALFLPLVSRVNWPLFAILAGSIIVWGFAIRGAAAVLGGSR